MDGSTCEINRADARGLVPYARVFASPLLRAPIEGVLCHKGKPLPVLGPLPSADEISRDINNRPWIVIFEDHAQVIRGLPDFGDQSATLLQFEEAEAPKAQLRIA